MSYLSLFTFFCAIGFCGIGVWWLIHRLLDYRVPQPVRPDQHIPQREMALVGDDWRDKISPYMNRLYRRRFIVACVTGGDCAPKEDETHEAR